MATYQLAVGAETVDVPLQAWQFLDRHCADSGCGLAAFMGTSRWTRITADTLARTYTYACLAGHTWTRVTDGSTR
ncbi:hypothetical protein OG216_47910 (plasmid) [Streptomycetaceae bacterium NBC_01309]